MTLTLNTPTARFFGKPAHTPAARGEGEYDFGFLHGGVEIELRRRRHRAAGNGSARSIGS